MITNVEREKYSKDGYLLIRNVLTAEQVKWLRDFFRPMFNAPRGEFDNRHRLSDVFVNYPEARWLCFHERTLDILRSMFGEDIVLLPVTVVHLNGFRGWHKDTDYYERSGLTFFKEKEYLMWQIAYYLQDNSPEYGGGLDVEPGSHLQPEDPFIYKPPFTKRSILERVWHQIDRSARQKYWLAWEKYQTSGYEPSNVVSIPSKAGDMVVIDSRLNHRATPPRNETPQEDWVGVGRLPSQHEKLAIFSTWSRNNACARALVDFSLGKTRETLPDYQFSYPADFLKEADKAGVKLIQ